MKTRTVRMASVTTFLILWEVASSSALVPRYLLLGPLEIIATLVRMLSAGELLPHITASMGRVAIGYFLAIISGVACGVLMGWFKIFDDIVDPIIELFRPVSPLALLPLTILWLGIGEPSKWMVIWYGCFFPILINTYAGVRSVPKSAIEAALTLGANTREMLIKVIFRQSLPTMMTGARISFSVAMIVMVAAEMINASQGLGSLILNAQQTFRTDELYVGIVTIAVIGFMGDLLLRALKQGICPWSISTERTTSSK